MSNFLHWVQIDATAAAKAERALDGEQDGEVRDEIGFMAIHHAFANRFFPGTSVLHTRLRYLFFVPWLMQRVAGDRSAVSLSDRLKRAEAGAKDQLKEHGSPRGIIGRRSPPRQIRSQLPSIVYWNALQQWGFLRPHSDGTYPSRLEALKSLADILASEKRNSRDDDGVSVDDLTNPFVDGLPPACKQIAASSGALAFDLEKREKRFLFEAISSSSSPARDSIFARLLRSDADIPEPGSKGYDLGTEWPAWIREVCTVEERKTLKIASDAAALACIGRAVYAALVQTLRQKDGNNSGDRDHCELLVKAIDDYRSAACRLVIKDLKSLFPDQPFPEPVIRVLTKTQNWLQNGRRSQFMDLRKDYSDAETPRKLAKSRLRPIDRQRRLEWDPDEFSPAAPLHYRIGVVHQLVWDMRS
ncbi:DUF6361 family protein [Bradyrhizobium sp. B124]|uniref:DUF6361 family protein n=1 Tax=Bradyrhizobium sp. B124 TaxID=3140245 RepID=UPI0031834F24